MRVEPSRLKYMTVFAPAFVGSASKEIDRLVFERFCMPPENAVDPAAPTYIVDVAKAPPLTCKLPTEAVGVRPIPTLPLVSIVAAALAPVKNCKPL